jgi:hypothetical protein
VNDRPHRARGRAHEGSRDSRVAADKDDGWSLLPGLFSWDEVCTLFNAGSGHDQEWRFSVRHVTSDKTFGPLYAVRAALRRDGDDNGGMDP